MFISLWLASAGCEDLEEQAATSTLRVITENSFFISTEVNEWKGQ